MAALSNVGNNGLVLVQLNMGAGAPAGEPAEARAAEPGPIQERRTTLNGGRVEVIDRTNGRVEFSYSDFMSRMHGKAFFNVSLDNRDIQYNAMEPLGYVGDNIVKFESDIEADGRIKIVEFTSTPNRYMAFVNDYRVVELFKTDANGHTIPRAIPEAPNLEAILAAMGSANPAGMFVVPPSEFQPLN